MAKLLMLIYLVAALCATTMVQLAAAAPVIPISLKLLNEITSNRTIPTPWVIRFVAPGGQSEKEREAFNNAAMLVDSSIANFGVFTADTYDKARMLEGMGIRQLPVTRLTQFKATRPTGPKMSLSGRITWMNIELPPVANSDTIVNVVMTHTAMRYNHPITMQPIPAVTYVLSSSDLIERARFMLPRTPGDQMQESLAALSGGDKSIGVLFYFHLMKKNYLPVHAEINSLGARLGPRLTVFATEDSDVAKQFGLTTEFSAAAFYLKNLDVDKLPDKIATIASADELANAGACAAFGEEHATFTPAEYTKILDAELKSWHRDVSAYYHKSPLIKISHSTQFVREVMNNKAAITVIFMLREADKIFNKYHRTAIDFAAFVRDTYRVAPGIYNKLHPNLNLQTFWIDGEVQSHASQFLGTKTVPSIAFLLHAQGGNVAVKYFSYPEDVKKQRKKQGKDTEWPDVQDLMAFVASDQLLVGAPGMTTFVDADVKFNDDSKDGPASANTVSHNHRYLFIDRKHYSLTEEKSSEFLQELADGKITVDADHYAKEGAEDKTKKKAKKLSAKEEAKKKKLQEELERKRKEREERTKAKEEADKKRREIDAAKTKAEITAKAREEAKKAKKAGGKRVVNIEGESVTAPSLQPNRFKKDWNAWKKDWEADSRRMVDKYVKNVKGGIRVGKGLSTPDWKKSTEGSK